MNKKLKISDLTVISMFVVVLAVCSWLVVPAPVPFTMQTFGVFACLRLLGGKRGLIAILLYTVLGAFGFPFFSGFSGGIGVLFGATGGYIMGFTAMALEYWLLERLKLKSPFFPQLAMVIGLLLCYGFGTLWFVRIYMNAGNDIEVFSVLSKCVIPFIIPDLIKMVLALQAAKRLSKLIL